MVRWLCVVLVLAACGKRDGERPAAETGAAVGSGIATGRGGATRTECIAVRDHVVGLISDYYLRHPDETWDGLDRSDPAIQDGLDPAMTRENFATFLASEAGKSWLARARTRTVATPAMADTVEKCVRGAAGEHLACWLGAPTIEELQRCPNPD